MSRLAAGLCCRLFLANNWLGISLFRVGAPVLLVNLSPYWLPSFIRRAGAREYLSRLSAKPVSSFGGAL